METLAAKDQENFVHSLQTAQHIKGAKTPAAKAPKTPFKVPLNDENVFGKGGKTGKEGKSTLQPNAFVTPAGML